MSVRPCGMTLVEMVVVIVLMGIIGSTIGMFIVPMMQSYQAVRQRAELVDSAESALRKIARDIRIALPNSVRVTTTLVGATGFALELVPTTDGGRYCVSGDANCALRPGDPNLDVAAADGGFDILGCFRNASFMTAAGAGTTAYRLVVNNSTAAEIYGSTGAANQVMTPSGSALTLTVSPGTGAGTCGTASATPGITNVHHVVISPGYDFLSDSARRRVFVIENAASAVTYVCDTTAGNLTRYAGYGIQSTQPNQPGAAPLTGGSVVTQRVSACSATSTGVIQGVGLVTLDLSVTLGAETVRLVHQLQLDNSE